MNHPLQLASALGQSFWLDSLGHHLVAGGGLQRLIEEDGICGLTSNPSIFERAIAGTDEYRDVLQDPESRGLGAKAMYECIATRDIRGAADLLLPVYQRTGRRDGYVSLEVSPHLAHDTEGTLAEARRLWRAVNRDNLMIKVPGTREGIPAVRQLIAEGLNVNVTLLFATDVYEQVSTAYLDGLDTLIAHGGDPARVASVASFFISRIDTAADTWLAHRIDACGDPDERALLQSLRGRIACANARAAYQLYLAMTRTSRWQDLARLGAQTQRLLWASTGTKNPEYRDVLYVEELIGPDTINTLPPATLEAFRHHGRVRESLTENPGEAARTLSQAEDAGVPLRDLTDQLLTQGIQLFTESFDKLLKATGHGEPESDHDPIEHLRIRLFKELCAGMRPS